MTKQKWLRVLLIGGVLLLAASFGFSRALRARAVRRYLIAHLAASFGRAVDVSCFDFSLLDGARIEAHFVTVADDPHFGNEYFLRADTLTAGVRWTSLLAGRFEFGSVSLTRPSLTLARDSDGHWNIERWLPPAAGPGARPGFMGPVAPLRDVRAARPYRIDVDGGRINFKNGDDKSSFALADVSGRVEENSGGRWQLDLEARPMRAGVELQDMGTLGLRGSIAGTAARLQPADLHLTWRAASLADALRFVRQDDYGMRGQLAVDLDARIGPQETSLIPDAISNGAEWSISGAARLTGAHGWSLPERATDPAANLAVEMNWRPGEHRVEIRKWIVELPASQLQGDGALDWSREFRPQLLIASSALAFDDVLSWYRALHPGVAEDLRAEGALGLDLRLGGWPIEIQQGALTSAGGTLTAKSLPASLQIGALHGNVSRGEIDFAPLMISSIPAAPQTEPDADTPVGTAQNAFVLRATLLSGKSGDFRWPPDWKFSIEGATSRMQDWLALSGSLAQPVNSGWTAEGGIAIKMRADHRAESLSGPGNVPVNVSWLGTIDFIGLTVSPSYINQPLVFPKAHIEFAPLGRSVALSSAEAFGAVWRGSISRKYSDMQWNFDLSVDQLDAAELDRWLGPRARPAGFLARFAGLNSAAAPATPFPDAVVTRLEARGRLRAGLIAIPPMRIERFDGEAELAGRTIRIRKAQGDFFGGKVSGSLDALLLPDPTYDFQGRFDRVDLSELGDAVAFLNARIGGNASATLHLSAHGVGRQDLIGSMQGQGILNGRNVELRGFDLSAAFPGNHPDSASDPFASVQGTYRIQKRGIDLANFVMESSKGKLEAEGRIEFSHALEIRVHTSIFQAAAAPASASPPSFLLGGTIELPKLVLPQAASKPAARQGPR